MTASAPADTGALIDILKRLTSRQRMDFSRYCESNLPHYPGRWEHLGLKEVALSVIAGETDLPAFVEANQSNVTWSQAEIDVAEAIEPTEWLDGTVDNMDIGTLFDIEYGELGFNAWAELEGTLAAMARAITGHDEAALRELEPAFAWLASATAEG